MLISLAYGAKNSAPLSSVPVVTMASLFFPPTRPLHLTPPFLQNPQHIPSLLLSFKPPRTQKSQALTICSALTESNSPKSLDDDEDAILPLLQELAVILLFKSCFMWNF